MDNFKFLSDNAVFDSNDDLLKHPSIAEVLKIIILKAPVPFTIGLFGKWGAGKSTIINFLKEKLNTEKTKIPVITFDVWKYENDSLRRQFLLTLEKELKNLEYLDKSYKVNPSLTNTHARIYEGKVTFSKKALAQLVSYPTASIIAITIIIVLFIFYHISIQLFLITIGSSIAAIVSLISIPALLTYIPQLITTETETMTFNKFEDPDEFEKEFTNILEATKAKKMVIVFDNLDRATYDKAVELLSTIKTFLEPKSEKCIFLVPCDEDAIKGYLESVYTKTGVATKFDSDEFLRKFFNTFIRIPDFIGADLEAYIKDQLKKTEVSEFQDNSDLVAVITLAFRDNPRQIKQFINTLLAHHLLAVEREKGKDALIKPSGTITNNSAFLAKILVIKQKWSDFYSEVASDPTRYSEPGSSYSGLSAFLIGTSIISTDNIRAFIYLKQPSPKLAIAGIEAEKLEITFKDNKKEDAKKIISGFKKDKIEENKIFDFVKELLKENKNSRQILVNIIEVSDTVLKELGISLVNKRDFCETLISVVSRELATVLPTLPMEFIFACLQESRPAYRKNVISNYASLLGVTKEPNRTISDSFLIDIVTYINLYPTMFNSAKQQITNSLTNANFDNIPALEILFKRKESIDDYIQNQLIQKLIISINFNDFVQKENESNDLFIRKMDLLLNPNLELNSNNIYDLLGNLTNIISAINQNQAGPTNEKNIKEILSYSEKIILKYKNLLTNTDTNDNFVRIINESIAKLPNYPLRTPFIPVLHYIRDYVSQNNKDLIDTLINQYGQHSNLDSIKEFLENRNNETALELFSPIKTHIENLGMVNLDILDFIWNYETEEDKSRIILQLLTNQNIRFALNRIEKENYKVKEEKLVVQNLLTKAPGLSFELKVPIYTTVMNMKCGDDPDLTKVYLDQLEQLILTTDINSQDVGYKLYKKSKKLFKYSQNVSFTEHIITWLMNQSVVTNSHKFALQTAISNWDNVSLTYQDNLLIIIFDRILGKSQTIDDINMAIELINEVSIPKGLLASRENGADNEDTTNVHIKLLNDRIDTETNPDIKSSLKAFISKISSNL